jgi:hypothetical protein
VNWNLSRLNEVARVFIVMGSFDLVVDAALRLSGQGLLIASRRASSVAICSLLRWGR